MFKCFWTSDFFLKKYKTKYETYLLKLVSHTIFY